MDVSQLSTVTKLGAFLGIALILYQIFIRVSHGLKQRSLRREKGCLPAPLLNTGRFDFMGIAFFRRNLKIIKAHKILDDQMQRFRTVGANTLQVVVLGRRIHLTMEPENLKHIQAVDFKKWGLGRRRKTGFRPLLGDGIFTTDGPPWAHSREMLRPNFVRSQVGDLATFERHVSHLISAIPKDGSTVDLSTLFFQLTIDSATEFLFGESTDSLTKDSAEGFAEAFNRSQENIAKRSRFGIWAKLLPKDPVFEKDRDFVHAFVDYYVKKSLSKRDDLLKEKSIAEKSGRYVFIDELVRQTTDPIVIRSEALHVLLAGRDTTASLLTNVWFFLSKRPDIFQKLQEEVAQLDNEAPTFEQLKELKYLRALLNESLRLHPVVPANSREAQEDTTLPLGGGPDGMAPIFIPKGGTVVWSAYAMHRRKDYYGEDAEEFKPERWLDDPVTGKKGLRPGWEYLPFNGGPRICLGQQFALTEASYTTARLCQAFSGISSMDPGPWVESLTLTCVNLNGAKLVLQPRV